ncbi:hypothetical protein MTBSS4_70110 [Magnetospirillum sp. SS-4]|nr:hypothetical protein MTBSS4_70110 [Magnetospirillum sp. SS-4]
MSSLSLIREVWPRRPLVAAVLADPHMKMQRARVTLRRRTPGDSLALPRPGTPCIRPAFGFGLFRKSGPVRGG